MNNSGLNYLGLNRHYKLDHKGRVSRKRFDCRVCNEKCIAWDFHKSKAGSYQICHIYKCMNCNITFNTSLL